MNIKIQVPELHLRLLKVQLTPEQHNWGHGVHSWVYFFLLISTTDTIRSMVVAESTEVESKIWRDDCKVIHRCSTLCGSAPLTPTLFKGQLNYLSHWGLGSQHKSWGGINIEPVIEVFCQILWRLRGMSHETPSNHNNEMSAYFFKALGMSVCTYKCVSTHISNIICLFIPVTLYSW